MKNIKMLFIGIAFICIFSSCGQEVYVKPEDRIIMVNDKLYYGTTETGPMGFSDAIEGTIQSTVNANEIPQKNGQSNFGEVGASYTDDADLGFIMVQINDEWYVFYAEK